jgi:hypothetical protein
VQQAVISGKTALITEILQGALLDTISFYDYRESYYHAFLAGLLNGIAEYSLKSNRESGYGRPDLTLDRVEEYDVTLENEYSRTYPP